MAGKPYIVNEAIVYEQPVSVEIAEIDKLTQTNVAPLQAPKPQKKKAVPKKLPEISPSAIRKKPQEPKQKEITSPLPKPPEPDIAKLKIPDPEKPKKPDNSLEKPQTPAKPKPTVKKAESEPKKDKDIQKTMDSLLVSLVGEQEPVKQDLTKPEDTKKTAQKPKESEDTKKTPNIQRFADKLTISERDALLQQLYQCWNPMAGARKAKDLVVVVHLQMNPDRTVRSAQILNKQRYNKDPFFRSAADSALRAVRNPSCTSLKLPPDKYEEWKTIVIRFDPRHML